MNIDDININDLDAKRAADKLLSDEELCKQLLLDMLKVAKENDELKGLVNQIIGCGDTVAEMIRLGRPQAAMEFWLSFRTEDGENE